MENLLVTSILSHLHFTHVILALLGIFIFICITQRLATKGPMIWPFIGMIPSVLLHFHEIHDWSTRALIKSGGTHYYTGLWIMGGFKGVVTADPMKVEYMLKTKLENFPKGKYFRERFHDLLENGIFNVDGDEWKEQRRIAMSEMYTSRFMAYSFKVMQGLVHEKLLKVISRKNNNYVDLQDLLLRFTFDNISITAFGVDPGCLALDLPTKISFAKAFEEATEYSLFRFMVPPFVWKFMRFFNLGKEKKLKEAIKIVHEFADATIKNRKVDLCRKNEDHQSQEFDDLLSRLLMKQGGLNFDKFLRGFCISFMLAGRDTSSVALVWFFWLISRNPDVESKIVHEVTKIANITQNKGGENVEIVFDTKDLEKMVYLQAAIAEALRLYPPVPINFKETKENEVYPDGMRVSKGSRVFYHIYAMGRMESIWGKDCEEFKPERWIKNGQFVSENQFKYVIFNAGPRICVGKKFADLQMKMIAASILLRYKVNVKEDQVIAPKVTTTLYMKHGLLVTFEPRMINC